VAVDTRLHELLRTWRESEPTLRRRLLLLLAMAIALAVQITVWLWYIDDAAISFSFARNFVDGHGLVAQPGGERVEGYSNPLWIALLSLWECFGVSGFISSKLMGAAFGLATIPLVWAIARYSRPDRDEVVPLLAAFALATNVQFGIWATSGLENSLFGLLLAAAIWRTLVETRTRGFPWSAALFLGIALTRPEGIAYAALGGFAAMGFALQDGRGLRPTLVWLAVFFVPFGAYHAIRYDYFAWIFPNTYYAKIDNRSLALLDWNAPGWAYVRGYAGLAHPAKSPGPGLGQGYLLPLYLIGLLGSVGRRGWLAVAFVATLLLLPGPSEIALLPSLHPGEWLASVGVLSDAAQWVSLRVLLLLAFALIAPFGALRNSGGRALALCWGMAVVALAFAVASRGDWMRGFRWFAFLAVPASVLAAAGVGQLRDWLIRNAPLRSSATHKLSAAIVLSIAAVFVLPQLRHIHWFTWHVPISVSSVRLRVDYLERLLDTLHLEQAVVLDMDMGAHLYWSRAEFIDMAGLVSIPIARHKYSHSFTQDFLFRERRPDFMHAHGVWEERLKLQDHAEWQEQYIELPGYLHASGRVHAGSRVRRDHLFVPKWQGEPGRRVAFRNGATLSGFRLPGLPSAPGLELFIEVGLEQTPAAAAAAPDTRPDATANTEGIADVGYQLEIFLANASGVVAHRVVTPGYGWSSPSQWRAGETFHGRYTLPLPANLAPGQYDLGFLIRDDGGRVVPAITAGRRAGTPPDSVIFGGTRGKPARLARGEVRFPNAVSLAPYPFALDRNRANLAAAERLAAELQCEGAESRYERIRRRMVHQRDSLGYDEAALRRAIAECWIARAAGSNAHELQSDWIVRARQLDPTTPALQTTAREIAAGFFDAAEAARNLEDWDASYGLYSSALRADPRLAWARRYAEEVRIERLSLKTPVRAW
jgi:hypothetical protein